MGGNGVPSQQSTLLLKEVTVLGFLQLNHCIKCVSYQKLTKDDSHTFAPIVRSTVIHM